MATTVLRLRMEALAQHLREAGDPSFWLDNLRLSPMPDRDLWRKAVEAIGQEAQNLRADLLADMESATDDAQDAEKQWENYFRIYERSQEIFRESLELLGGLALRDRIQEEYACRFADDLIKECSEFVGKAPSLAIPATEDALSSTLRRVARVNFPDWHLWALPLVAHEYGQVVVVRETSLDRLVCELAEKSCQPFFEAKYRELKNSLQPIGKEYLRSITADLIAQAERNPQKAADPLETLARMLHTADEEEIEERTRRAARSLKGGLDAAMNRARVLVSDAFATFTAGPAYACAALMLRLNPNTPPVSGRPTDEERAETILAILAEMDAATANPPPPFAKVGETLRSSWGMLLGGAGRHGQSAQPLDAAQVFGKIKNQIVSPRAEFTKADWLRAQSLSTAWWTTIKEGQQPDVTESALPHIGELRLRHVLNAAWHCRLLAIEQADDVAGATDKIMDAARQLCDRILANRRPLVTRSEFGGRAPRPGEA